MTNMKSLAAYGAPKEFWYQAYPVALSSVQKKLKYRIELS